MNYQSTGTALVPVAPADDLPVMVDPQVALKRYLRIGLITVGLLVFGLFGLAAVVDISGAVIAPGQVSVESKVKKIGHPTGGVIAEIYVRDGARVKAGDALMRLDTTVSGVSASVSSEGLIQLLARRARLEAERDGRPYPVYPPQLLRSRDPMARVAMAEETRQFRLKQQARAGLHAQLRDRVRQMEQQIGGYQGQIAANSKQSELIKPELEGVRGLWEKKLVTINKLNSLERTAVDLDSSSSSLGANIAQTRARISEIREQAIQVDQEARSQAGTELAEVITALNDQQVRQVSTGDTVDRSLIRAPYNGVVDKLAFSTIGGVVPPAETIMEIVPDSDQMVVEAKISPADVDQLSIGQGAVLRFSAFNMQTTPEINGRLTHVSAEAKLDERSGYSFYNVRLEVPAEEMRRLRGLKLVPGMPVEAFIQTGERSLLSFITKPLRDQLNRSFRQE
jgi:HlyD family secretion protein